MRSVSKRWTRATSSNDGARIRPIPSAQGIPRKLSGHLRQSHHRPAFRQRPGPYDDGSITKTIGRYAAHAWVRLTCRPLAHELQHVHLRLQSLVSLTVNTNVSHSPANRSSAKKVGSNFPMQENMWESTAANISSQRFESLNPLCLDDMFYLQPWRLQIERKWRYRDMDVH